MLYSELCLKSNWRKEQAAQRRQGHLLHQDKKAPVTTVNSLRYRLVSCDKDLKQLAPPKMETANKILKMKRPRPRPSAKQKNREGYAACWTLSKKRTSTLLSA